MDCHEIFGPLKYSVPELVYLGSLWNIETAFEA